MACKVNLLLATIRFGLSWQRYTESRQSDLKLNFIATTLFKTLLAISLIALIAGSISACGALRTFDVLIPYDSGAQKLASDVAFGADPRQTLDVYSPVPVNKTASYPVIVFIYGGSWASGNKNDYGFVGHALAARGFVTVIPNYRLVPAVRFPDFVNDGAAAMRWVQDNVQQFGGDATRVVLMGHSAGAYNAMMLALDGRFLAQSGVNAKVVKGIVGIAGAYDFLPFDVDATVNAFSQFPDSSQTQPITFTRANAPPALLLTGDADTTVQPRNSIALAKKLNAAGASAELKTYPDVGHVGILLSLSRPQRSKAPTLQDAIDFAVKVTSSKASGGS